MMRVQLVYDGDDDVLDDKGGCLWKMVMGSCKKDGEVGRRNGFK